MLDVLKNLLWAFGLAFGTPLGLLGTCLVFAATSMFSFCYWREMADTKKDSGLSAVAGVAVLVISVTLLIEGGKHTSQMNLGRQDAIFIALAILLFLGFWITNTAGRKYISDLAKSS